MTLVVVFAVSDITPSIHSLLIAVGIAFAAASVGKIAGLVSARWRLAREIQHIGKLLEQPQHG
ncbi:hypothetical protein [Nocardia sp. NPDC050412]|uniref:hypothetical protein n=1 Tax=Nocardia sp. NPDC050412 TaxID=3364320 RepID=UPI00378BA5EE